MAFLDFFSQLLSDLIAWDKELLLSLNGCHNTFFDSFMYWVSDRWVWIPMYAAMLYWIVKSKKREVVLIVVGIVLTVVLADQFSATVCKPLFARFRPSHDPEIGHLVHVVLDNRGSMYGFVSSHAANTLGLAVFTALLFKNKWFTLLISLWAAINCYSRIYLGMHFPLDLLCGGLAGGLIGAFSYWVYKLLLRRLPQFAYVPYVSNSRTNVTYATRDMAPFVCIYLTTFFFIALFSSKGFIA